MDLEHLLPGIIGAFVGVVGWFFVGLYIQRRQFWRQARNAARAVYFELDVNRTAIMVARDFGSYVPLGRSSFERLLPDLSTVLSPDELRSLAAAYMGHAGYQQLASGGDAPSPEMAQAVLMAIAEAQDRAMDVLRRHAFSARESAALLADHSEVAPDGATPSRSEAR